MDIAWMVDYAKTKKAAEIDYKIEWEATRFLIDGKMFGMIGENTTGEPIITLKMKPENGEFLREKYDGKIIPGHYMNKVHWNSVFLTSDVPRDVIKSMIDESYELILGGLSKKRQAEILEK